MNGPRDKLLAGASPSTSTDAQASARLRKNAMSFSISPEQPRSLKPAAGEAEPFPQLTSCQISPKTKELETEGEVGMFRSVRLPVPGRYAGVLVSNAKANIGFNDGSAPEESKEKSPGEPAAPGAAADASCIGRLARDDNAYTSHEDNPFRMKQTLKERGVKPEQRRVPPFFTRRGSDAEPLKGRTIRPDGTIANSTVKSSKN